MRTAFYRPPHAGIVWLTDGNRKGKLTLNWIEEVCYFSLPHGCVCSVSSWKNTRDGCERGFSFPLFLKGKVCVILGMEACGIWFEELSCLLKVNHLRPDFDYKTINYFICLHTCELNLLSTSKLSVGLLYC